jgi:hypothetical protein
VGKLYDEITPELADWLGRQRVFFVATAPLAADGLVNCSPKGMDTFRIFSPREVAYLDLTGSGIETVAHLRENGRIVFTFCAFEGPPKIVRMHGTGEVVAAGSPEFEKLRALFPDHPGARVEWAQSRGPDGLVRYRRDKNTRSLDDLPGLDPCD